MPRYQTYLERRVSTSLSDEIENASWKYYDELDSSIFNDDQKELLRLAFIAGANKFREIIHMALEQ